MTTRTDQIRSLVSMDTYPGTADLVAAIYAESKNHPSWRPGRAGALHAYAALEERVWITPQQFAEWFTVQTFAAKRFKRVKPLDAIGMSSKRKLRLIRGEVRATKMEALACAHVAMGYDIDFDLFETEAFSEWATKLFGSFAQLAHWLGVSPVYLTDRVRGFDVKAGERIAKEPEVTLIRAMDWISRCGPFVPYGEDVRPALFPGQRA